MGTQKSNCKPTYNLLGGLRGLISAAKIWGISALNLEVEKQLGLLQVLGDSFELVEARHVGG